MESRAKSVCLLKTECVHCVLFEIRWYLWPEKRWHECDILREHMKILTFLLITKNYRIIWIECTVDPDFFAVKISRASILKSPNGLPLRCIFIQWNELSKKVIVIVHKMNTRKRRSTFKWNGADLIVFQENHLFWSTIARERTTRDTVKLPVLKI